MLVRLYTALIGPLRLGVLFTLTLRKHAHVIYNYFLSCKIEAVLTGNHNLCLEANLRKVGTCIPLHTTVLLYKILV